MCRVPNGCTVTRLQHDRELAHKSLWRSRLSVHIAWESRDADVRVCDGTYHAYRSSLPDNQAVRWKETQLGSYITPGTWR